MAWIAHDDSHIGPDGDALSSVSGGIKVSATWDIGARFAKGPIVYCIVAIPVSRYGSNVGWLSLCCPPVTTILLWDHRLSCPLDMLPQKCHFFLRHDREQHINPTIRSERACRRFDLGRTDFGPGLAFSPGTQSVSVPF